MGGTSMLLGQVTTSIDNKKRMIIPAKFRGYFQDTQNLIVSRGFEDCLVVRSIEEFTRWQEKILHQSEGLKESRILSRQIFANSEEVTIDNKGRITIPSMLLEISKISNKVVVIALANKLEIWSETAWKDFNDETKDQLVQAAATLKEF
ncbi:division/cell wall cluster transcriptional repressor MraZ [Spiroplasma attinicola]|uniref:division/cell wall cluster transcriptional repressor MraZ n=1 Tax=Spiroplasma attinicola TaxID=2904537 RepID=UPI002022F2FF|nr:MULTISPECIES: division/cell wall cluster transcriptional repressor MraZ [unclassified Spiroplasma]